MMIQKVLFSDNKPVQAALCQSTLLIANWLQQNHLQNYAHSCFYRTIDRKLNIIADNRASFFRKADGFFHLFYLATRDI